jgi:hypothetical protein
MSLKIETKIQMELNGVGLEFTREQAKELYDVLGKELGISTGNEFPKYKSYIPEFTLGNSGGWVSTMAMVEGKQL